MPDNKYNYNDFTEFHYVELLEKAKNKWNFISYNDALTNTSPHILWRHDIDMSVHRALALAKLEHQAGVMATYFVMLHSNFYNIFEKEILDKIKEIKNLGHDIGLHFDPSFYLEKNSYKIDIENAIQSEKYILEELIETEIKTFSFHVPDASSSIDMKALKLGGLLNVYADDIQKKYFYTSDSNGYWRFHRLNDVIDAKEHDFMQVLTHPEWWVPEASSPNQRVLRAINGRQQNVLNTYETQMEDYERTNVK